MIILRGHKIIKGKSGWNIVGDLLGVDNKTGQLIDYCSLDDIKILIDEYEQEIQEQQEAARLEEYKQEQELNDQIQRNKEGRLGIMETRTGLILAAGAVILAASYSLLTVELIAHIF